MMLLFPFFVAVWFSLLNVAFPYIPALPTNSTQDAIAGGLNVTDISNLQMQWYTNGSYGIHVSYQLVGKGSTGLTRGVLVHFSEEMADNMTAPTLTPWIALVSCDKNATNASMEEDIFTLARDKGAVSALLYSLHSAACVINSEYSDPKNFDQVFDIFSTQSRTSSGLIEYQFGQLSPQDNKSIYAYDSDQLNKIGPNITASINSGAPISSGYLLATLRAYNATDDFNPRNSNTDVGSTNSSPNHTSNSALAMIILYAITGCVSALFLIVIISGAIRAIRHPERYGPRARMTDDGFEAQSRARGLTRAILDTFPVVKFGTPSSPTPQLPGPLSKDKDLHSIEYGMEMGKIPSQESEISRNMINTSSSEPVAKLDQPAEANKSVLAEQQGISQSGSPPELDLSEKPEPWQPPNLGEGPSRDVNPPVGNPSVSGANEIVPASIGRETCPICIVDFEEGDDIRVLPCEGNHCFHQACVDPWLLKLSSSCPICRHDFLALENMLSGHPDDDEDYEESSNHYPSYPPHQTNTGRFSRYLRLAIRRRRRGDEPDPTDPYMPTAPETSLYPSGM